MIKLIEICIKPQFVWDKKNINSWLLTDFSRDEFFCKELGILVFLNVCNIYSIPKHQIQFSLNVTFAQYDYFSDKLQHIKTAFPTSAYSVELQRALIRKTGLVINMVKIYHKRNLS